MAEHWRTLLRELAQELEKQTAELARLRHGAPPPSGVESQVIQSVPLPPLVPLSAPKPPDTQEQPKYMLDTSWSLSLNPQIQRKEASSVISSWIAQSQATHTSASSVVASSVVASSASRGTRSMDSSGTQSALSQSVHPPKTGMLRSTKEFSIMDAEKLGFTVMRAQKTKRFVAQKPWYIINPDTSTWANVWQGVVAAALLFVAFVTPVQVGLLSLQLDATMVVSFFIDFVFLVDMMLQFLTTYPQDTSNGIVWEVDIRMISLHYLQTWFLLDFVTVFPFDLMALMADSAMDEWKSIKVLRALRLLKLARLVKTSRMIHNLEIPLSIPYQKVALARFLVVLVLVCHWVACLWAMTLNLGEGDYQARWIDSIEDPESREPLRVYIAAFYFACYTITSVGFGDITPRNVLERTFCSAILLACGLAWAYIIGEVGAIVSDMTSESQEFRRRMHHLNVMMQEQSLPFVLRKRLRSFFLQNRHLAVFRTRQKLFDSMSPQLQNDVCMNTQVHWVRKVWFFDGFMRWIESKETLGIYTGHFYACVADITRQLNTAAFAQQETFANLQVLFILSKGLVMLDKKVGSHGEVWGEDFVLSDTSLIRPIAGTALTYIEVHYLTRTALFDVIERNRQTCPQLEKIVRRYVVRLACCRGVIAEARKLQQAVLKQKALQNSLRKSGRAKGSKEQIAKVPVMEVPPEIPPTPQGPVPSSPMAVDMPGTVQ